MPWGKVQRNNFNYSAGQVYPALRLNTSRLNKCSYGITALKILKKEGFSPHTWKEKNHRRLPWPQKQGLAGTTSCRRCDGPLAIHIAKAADGGSKPPQPWVLAPKGRFPEKHRDNVAKAPAAQGFLAGTVAAGWGRLDDPDDQTIPSRHIQAGGVRRHTKRARYGNTEERGRTTSSGLAVKVRI